MTKLRNRPKLDYHTLIVRPNDDFSPHDWRDRPESYTIVSYEGPQQFRGRADAWRFQFNQGQIRLGNTDLWAIVCTRLESFTSPSAN